MKTTMKRWILALLCVTFVMPREAVAIPNNTVTVAAVSTLGIYSYLRYKKVCKKIKLQQQEDADARKRLGFTPKPTKKQIIQRMFHSWMYTWAMILCAGAITAEQTGLLKTNSPAAGGTVPQTGTQTPPINQDGNQIPRSPMNQNTVPNTEDDELLAQALALSIQGEGSPAILPQVDLDADEAFARSLLEEPVQPQNHVDPIITPQPSLTDEQQLAQVLEASRIEADRKEIDRQNAEYEAALKADQERRAREAEEAHRRAEEQARQVAEKAEQDRRAAEQAAQEAAEAEAHRYYADQGITCPNPHPNTIVFSNGDGISECSNCKRAICVHCKRAHAIGITRKNDGMTQKCSDGTKPCVFVDKVVVFRNGTP